MKRYQNINILLIEDEEYDVRRVINTLNLFEETLKVRDVVSNGNEALDLLQSDTNKYDIVIMDYQIAGSLKGEDLIKRIKLIEPLIQVVVITKHTINITDFDFANKLLEAGAFWYCTKYPGDIEEYIYQPTDFLISIFNAYEKRLLQSSSNESNKKLKQNISDILDRKKIIGVSEFVNKLFNKIDKLAASDVSVLITGASGTGKELVANNIHYRSERKLENFIPINCGGIPHDLIESELFGYEKGAFTGAASGKAGLFELANNGTIFLDEIAELPLSAQVKLLRVLQEGEIEKIGRTKKTKVNVRVIAATNKNLEEAVKNGNFREDLYYRLNVVPLMILPLKSRKEDIKVLIEHFLEFFSVDMGIETPKISDDAIQFLVNYEWPGNVRELKNMMQRLLFNLEGKITLEDVQANIGSRIRSAELEHNGILFDDEKMIPLREMEKLVRKKYFEFVRERSESDAEAAAKLGLAPSNFYRMSKEIGLK